MAVMTKAVAELPDDVDALKAMIVAMADQSALLEARNDHLEVVNKTADERIATLTAIVRMLERSRYGTRSERLRGTTLSEEQHAFVFEQIETGIAAIEAELESAVQDKPKRAPRPRKGFAAHLERVEIVIEPEVPAGCEGLEKVLIGEDVSERLDVMPAKFRLIVTRRPKYAYRNRDGVIQAPAPSHIVESGIPTEALLAQIAVSKYADGLPLYRQEAIYARDQVELDRSLIRAHSFLSPESFQQTSALLASKEPPTAIIAGGIDMLAGVIRAIRVRGLRIPDDISLVGAGDSELAELHMPAISVQHWDQGEIGAGAANLLLNRIRNVASDEPQHVLVRSEFIERASIASPRPRGTL